MAFQNVPFSFPTAHIERLGVPDRYIEHSERSEQLAELGLDPAGIAAAGWPLVSSECALAHIAA